jgi:hypothetical protein
MILQTLFPTKVHLIICGDFNINYLKDSDSETNALLNLYNLFSTVSFPTSIEKDYISVIDNIFIDTSKLENCKIFPLNNALLVHNVQLIMNISLDRFQNHQTYFKRKINKSTIADF